MMPPQEDLNNFLRDLSGRRLRLLELAESTSGPESAVVDELNDLSEQLIVADEELRVQQEELLDARRRIEVLCAERVQLFGSMTEAWVLTDERGVVVRTTRAADQLILLPASRLKPRPIATWFAVPDRSLIRRMIGRSGSGETQVLDRAELKRMDGSTATVRVALTRTVGEGGSDIQLRWHLSQLDVVAPSLRLVETDGPPASTGTAAEDAVLGARLAGMTGRLTKTQPVAEAWSRIITEALTSVPGVDHAGLVLYRRRGPGLPLAFSDPTAAAADLLDLELGGPLVETLAHNQDRRLADTELPSPWPAFAARATALGIRSVLTVPLTVPSPVTVGHRSAGDDEPERPEGSPPAEQRVGALTLYADAPAAFDARSELVAALLAAHAASALIWLNREISLRDALASRQLIGEAVGVLVERQKLTSAAAFEVLVHRSQNVNLKLRELARIVVETGQDPCEIFPP